MDVSHVLAHAGHLGSAPFRAREAYFRESYYEAQNDRFTDTAVYTAIRTTWSP
jgi:hypothetical protein